MTAIIIEGLLFLALVFVAGSLGVLLLRQYTPIGRRLQQTQNRKRIDRRVDLVCPIHGEHDERELVRLESGELLCPDCYREAMLGR